MVIKPADIDAALRAWGDGLVAIALAHDSVGPQAARDAAERFVDTTYGYELGPVLFKPTMASGTHTFRPTRKGCLSYFVAHDPDFPNDQGFALKGWREVTTETAATFIDGSVAMWTGWVHCIDARDDLTTVDKSFGYHKGDDGTVRIVLHHSSFPYQP